MATISSFRELRVHQSAFEAAMRIYRISKAWPAEERFELTSRTRRSSRSVCACTAEGWRKRRYPAAFVAKLNDAEAEAAETRVWLDFALACGYLDTEQHPQSPSPKCETKPDPDRPPSAARPDPQSRRTPPQTPPST